MTGTMLRVEIREVPPLFGEQNLNTRDTLEPIMRILQRARSPITSMTLICQCFDFNTSPDASVISQILESSAISTRTNAFRAVSWVREAAILALCRGLFTALV
ncbi:hypothetical protein KIN20_001154 [Parelaphostrongylus tenuis]|uniref:Uncharacterized protein n=1 Tax=Parelaphostrongylus tenuis TaxID=148309 RepID=A0AAD5LTN9_PARTN|nr:hypothetical protein KIN20_001154 [Parelaphostrongylus tenuis]